jgi:preprotein translocase subunit SecA
MFRPGLQSLVRMAEAQKEEVSRLSDRRLREAADSLRARLIKSGMVRDSVARAFALARESSSRHCGLNHHRVQLLAGAAMMEGALAEMQTGEGKTLVAVLPAITAALASRPVHIVTVNEYLAKRDADQLRKVYEALGLTVGLVLPGQGAAERRGAYQCDVTYCTNKDLVFDYLRDRLAMGQVRSQARRIVRDLISQRQDGNAPLLLRGLHFAIVDEADSVMIDEARTPLILSGAGRPNMDKSTYPAALQAATALQAERDFSIQAKEATVRLSALGKARLDAELAPLGGLWAIRQAREELVLQALSALHLFHRDKQYIVADGKVQIVDEYTGRVMPDRSWERGLHQLIEAKESCEITEPKTTLARITYQRFFRRYVHLCGMTGTATEAAGELNAVYGLSVVRIPTHRPLRRKNLGARILADEEEKWRSVVAAARRMSEAGRSVLIGTRSVEASERVGHLLSAARLDPVVLNARQDKDEAEIIARAGSRGKVTVATNMAGRGTDIKPDESVLVHGGLHVILTEYHESARVDRQLFGRAGRQGDPGSFEAIVAGSDDLFRRFGGGRAQWLLRQACSQRGWYAALLLRLLRWSCQSRAERQHALTRRQTLREDERLLKALGFAGLPE